MDLISSHRRALDACAAAVRGVGADQWTAPTPCDAWDVRALVLHLVSGNRWAAELARGKTIDEVGDRLDGDLLGDDPAGAFDASAGAATAAFDAPGALQAACAVSYGPVPGEVYLGHRFLDVLVHTWDLAVATGQDTELDPALVAACWEVVGPQMEMLKASGMFGDATEPPAGAAEPPAGAAEPPSGAAEPPSGPHDQTRLLVALGRRPD